MNDQRYGQFMGDFYPKEKGEWVKWEDFAALKAEVERLHERIAHGDRHTNTLCNLKAEIQEENERLLNELEQLKKTNPTCITEVDIKANPAWAIAVFRIHRKRDAEEIKRLKGNLEHKVYITNGFGGGVLRNPRYEDGWLPIETAPKDGTGILCWCVEPEFEGEENPYTEQRVCFFGQMQEDYSCWMSHYGYEQRPTHWMSLPNPPATQLH